VRILTQTQATKRTLENKVLVVAQGAQGAGVTRHAEALRPGDVTVAQGHYLELVAAQSKDADLENPWES